MHTAFGFGQRPKSQLLHLSSMASAAGSSRRLLFAILLLSLIFTPSLSDTCSSQTFSKNRLYNHCTDLPFLNSYLHWTYDQAQSTLSLAFIAPPPNPNGWISYALNPTGTGMVGSQALIAFKDSAGRMAVKTYNITDLYLPKESKVWFVVKEATAEFSDGVITLFATLILPEKKNTTNHVWQVGPVSNGAPAQHGIQPANNNAKGTLDLLSGLSTSGDGSVDPITKRKNIHGILNVVSWGILLPIGVLIARFLKQFESADPAWFYLHVFCQVSGFIIGIAGWGTGLKLGSQSKGIVFSVHRNIGIALFSLCTVQISALFLRPKKDHKYRFYWNIYHHGLGYVIIGLSVFNIFKGLDILLPEKKWRTAYIIFLIVFAAVAALLQVVSWALALRNRSRKSTKP